MSLYYIKYTVISVCNTNQFQKRGNIYQWKFLMAELCSFCDSFIYIVYSDTVKKLSSFYTQ